MDNFATRGQHTSSEKTNLIDSGVHILKMISDQQISKNATDDRRHN